MEVKRQGGLSRRGLGWRGLGWRGLERSSRFALVGWTVALVAALVGCTNAETLSENPSEPSIIVPAETPTAEIPAPTESPATDQPTATPGLADNYGWTNAQDLVDSITAGWNLGNTLDAHPHGFTAYHFDQATITPEIQETMWLNPVTTEAMIKEVAATGFNAIRIPVTWYPMLNDDLSIRPDWLDRVQQVVDYAYDNGLIVILNSHHDERMFGLGLENADGATQYLNDPARATKVSVAQGEEFVQKLWQQLAERFADYDHRLVFECLNEPRTIGSPDEWSGGTAPEREQLNRLNQICVDTIRQGDGFNPTRFLMVPTYAAAVNPQAFDGWQMPLDPAGPGRIIVSLHAYTPWRFALDASVTPDNCPGGCVDWSPTGRGDQDGPGPIDWALNLARNNFPDYPIIIGEMGALNRDNLDARVAWTRYYNDLAGSLDMRVFWWDNGQSDIQQPNGPDQFAIFDRRGLNWPFPEIVTALVAQASTG